MCLKKQRTFSVYFNLKKPNYNLRSVKKNVAADRPNILVNNNAPQTNLNNIAQAIRNSTITTSQIQKAAI